MAIFYRDTRKHIIIYTDIGCGKPKLYSCVTDIYGILHANNSYANIMFVFKCMEYQYRKINSLTSIDLYSYIHNTHTNTRCMPSNSKKK